MAIITEYFEQAQLSEAAYSEGLTSGWVRGGTEQNPNPYVLQLIYGGMSKTQAIDFANKIVKLFK